MPFLKPFARTLYRAFPAIVLAAFSLKAAAQEMPPSPVRYTEAREQEARKTLRLPGTVEARTSSLVASEVAGVVEKLLAREGDVVRKGEPLAQLRAESLRLRLQASQAQLKEATSRQKLAELSLARARDLFDQQVTSQQQLDDAQYEFNAWQGRVEQLAAEIKRIEYDLDHCTLRAPFAGTVVARRTEVGEWIAMGGPVLEMLSLEDLEIRVEVPERFFRSLRQGGETEVTFDSLPGHMVKGRVSAIIPKADPQARAFPVKIRVGNSDGRIGVGMLAQITMEAGESYRATVIPKDAVVRQGATEVVYLINGDNTVTPVTISTGVGLGPWVAVEGPIKAGQKVVTRGNERLRPGQKVQAERLDYKTP